MLSTGRPSWAVGPIRAAFATNPNTTVRSDNAAQFLLPGGLGGVEGGAMVAAGEGGDAASGRAKVVGIRLGYAAKGFGVSAATTRSENSLTADGRFKDTVLGGQFDVANVKLSAAWRQFEYSQAKQALLLLGAVATWGVADFRDRSEASPRSFGQSPPEPPTLRRCSG